MPPKMSVSSATAAIKGGPYISSAATIASLLLIILYFGISQAVSHGSYLHEIMYLKFGLADDICRHYVYPVTAEIHLDSPKRKGMTEDQFYKIVDHQVRSISLPQVDGFKQITLTPDLHWANAKSAVLPKSSSSDDDSFPIFYLLPRSVDVQVEVYEYREDRPWIAKTSVSLEPSPDNSRARMVLVVMSTMWLWSLWATESIGGRMKTFFPLSTNRK